MPWLIATPTLTLAAELTGSAAFAIAGFSQATVSTFLCASGVLSSVHTFANDPVRILGLIFVAI